MRRTQLILLALVSATCSAPPKPAPVTPPTEQPAAPAKAESHEALIEIARSGPTEKQYPQADAVVISSRDDVTLAADGAVTRHHKQIVRILDPQRGKAKYADVHIPYDRDRQTLTLEAARTANADGKVAEASAEEIADILPPRIRDAAIYSSVRERVVTFPAVDTGSALELEYTITTRATDDAPMGGELRLATWNPILERVVTLTAPANAPLAFHVEGMPLQPAEASDQSAGTRTLTFRAENLPDRQREMQTPADSAILPRLVYSFVPSWKAALARISERFLRVTAPKPMPAAIVAHARELTAGAKSDSERVAALLGFVAHEIRSIDLPLGWAGYAPNPPETVLANRYGDSRDKVGLIVAMCTALDIDARPAFARKHGVPVLEDVPTIAQFDDIVVRVTIGDRETWINPADRYAQMGTASAGQDGHVLLLDSRGGSLARRPQLPPTNSSYTLRESLAINKKGDLDARFHLEQTGWFASIAQRQLRARKGEYLDRFFQASAVDIAPSAESKKHSVGDLESVQGPVVISQQVLARGYAQAQGRFRVVELPRTPFDPSSFAPPIGSQKREYPLWLGTPRTTTEELSIELPPGWKVAFRPPDLEAKAPGVSYTSQCEAKRRQVLCHRVLTFDRREISPSDYAAFRQALNQMEEYNQRVLLLRR